MLSETCALKGHLAKKRCNTLELVPTNYLKNQTDVEERSLKDLVGRLRFPPPGGKRRSGKTLARQRAYKGDGTTNKSEEKKRRAGEGGLKQRWPNKEHRQRTASAEHAESRSQHSRAGKSNAGYTSRCLEKPLVQRCRQQEQTVAGRRSSAPKHHCRKCRAKDHLCPVAATSGKDKAHGGQRH